MKRLTWEFTTLRVILLCVGAVLGGFGIGFNVAAPSGEALPVWRLVRLGRAGKRLASLSSVGPCAG